MRPIDGVSTNTCKDSKCHMLHLKLKVRIILHSTTALSLIPMPYKREDALGLDGNTYMYDNVYGTPHFSGGYHGDPAHVQAVCTRPSPFVYSAWE